MDIVWVAAAVGFFAVSYCLIRLFDRLQGEA
jgi:hypothetical protein